MSLVSSSAGDLVCERPTDAAGYAGFSYDAPVASVMGTHVVVWYTLTGTQAADPDEPAIVRDVVDAAFESYVAKGFRAPLADAGCGGDDRLDVYLVHMSGADGMTAASCGSGACDAFILAESKLARLYGDTTIGVRTVLPHELFHAVQDAYDAGIPRFWAEGTAQWAAKSLDPTLVDLEKFLPAYFAEPSRALDAPVTGVTGAFLYGSAIWPVFLSARFGDDVVRRVLETSAPTLVAIDGVLQQRGSSLADAFSEFAAWNSATGDRVGDGGYAEAATYPMVRLTDGSSGTTSGLGAFYFAVHADADTIFDLDTDPARNAGTLVPIGDVAHAQPLPSTFSGDAIVVVNGITSSKSDAPFTVTSALAPVAEPPMETGCRAAGGQGPAVMLLMLSWLLGRFGISDARRPSPRGGSSLHSQHAAQAVEARDA